MTTAAANYTTSHKISVVLEALKAGDDLNKSQFAKDKGISRSTLTSWMKKYGDQALERQEAKKAALNSVKPESKKTAQSAEAPAAAPEKAEKPKKEKKEKEEKQEPELTPEEAEALRVFKEIRANNSVLSRNGKPKQKPTKLAVTVWLETEGEREPFVAEMVKRTGKEEKKCQLDWLACSHYLLEEKDEQKS